MISFDENRFFKDGKPWFPVMGEYQYSRTDERYWREGMRKMKSLGIDAVSSYCFWLHHEEIKGRFDFRGNRNLRKFVSYAKEEGLLVCLRIGPWVHAEARNGGFPDWIYDENIPNRRNNAEYLFYTERYFRELYRQCEGLMYRDGGPIFAIQVENEYAQWGRQTEEIGDVHINKLISMLREIGFSVPVYMATGWGDAAVGEALPVWGSYCEAPWEDTSEELPPVDGYLFSHNSNDANIGSETGRKEMVADITKSKFPWTTVELGSGIQVTRKRRPVIGGDDVAAMVLCKVGSGVSAIGYYVFHGGANPVGALSDMQEYRDLSRGLAGFYCELAPLDYDFQAPIGRYGEMRRSAKCLKAINYFVRDFGDELGGMKVVFPQTNPENPADLSVLRYSVRTDGKRGFVFINNYVRHSETKEYSKKGFSVETDGGEIVFPDFTVKKGDYGIFPFNLPYKSGVIRSACVTPFCKLNGVPVFRSPDGRGAIVWEGEADGNVLILTDEQAENAFRFSYEGEERLFFTEGEMYESESSLFVISGDICTVVAYPPLAAPPKGFSICEGKGKFATYRRRVGAVKSKMKVSLKRAAEEFRDFLVEAEYGEGTAENIFLTAEYGGDRIEAYVYGEKVADGFYTGLPLKLGLRDYGYPREIVLRVYPLSENADIYLEKKPRFVNGTACGLYSVKTETVYLTEIPKR